MKQFNTQRQFVFSPWLTLLTIGLLVLMLSLGRWQMNKAEFRRAQLQSFASASDAASLLDVSAMPERYARIALNGVFDDQRQIIMDGFSRDKRPGFQVLSPFRLHDSGQLIMVNRGWRLWEGPRDQVEGLAIKPGSVRVTGLAERFWRPGMTLGDGNQSEVTQWPQLAVYPSHDEITAWLGEEVATWQLLLDDSAAHGFVRDWKPTGLSPARHTGYAWQWFALSATLFVLYWVASWRPLSSGDKE